MNFSINEELKKLPNKPGVYLMKDNTGNIIYVGKAISLKNRVRQYFQSSKNKHPKVVAMVRKIDEFEYIITDNEVEALILEANLIKKHKPKYNVLLRDDKQYPYIKVTVNESYPRVLKVREIKKDGAKYFGPYTSTGAVNDTLEIIRNLYMLRTCNLNLNKKVDQRPCLNYYINRCLGPCQGNVDKEVYSEMINEIIMFLNGKEEKLLNIMKEQMIKASKNLDFEEAAKYRDKISSLNHMLEKQKIVSTNAIDEDIIGMSRGIDEVCIVVFFVRNGKMMGREHFIITGTLDEERSSILSSFVKQFYISSTYIPKEILIENEIDDEEVISKWLSEKRGTKVALRVPKIGDKNKLMEMVRKNASEILNQSSERIKKKSKDNLDALNELKEILGLDVLPKRIEAFDISNTQGLESVGSMVVFENGSKKSRDYRRFKIKSVIGPDDYSSMDEILRRRFLRGIEERNMIKDNNMNINSFSIFPDLILMDGGKGQVNIAKKVLNDFNIDIDVCGMVKDDNHNTRGLIFNDKEIIFKSNDKTFLLITRIQDEAHRFAISYHRSLRDKKVFKSVLDEIQYIGEKRKKALLKHFGSIDGIRKASLEELSEVEGMNSKSAQSVFNFFRGEK